MKKVFVGLSGGVDSSVCAALLQAQGFEVIGVFIKVWQPDFLECTWREDRVDAMRVCAKLGIPFLTLDFSKEYKERVVNEMITSYERGETPNPDTLCNQHIKFGSFLEEALRRGADYVATGHYAIKSETAVSKLLKSKDAAKDQTYFLWRVRQKQLQHVLFPVGHLDKNTTRSLAKKYGLPTARKRDSQGLCFLGELVLEDFLAHFLTLEPGKVLSETGREIGVHSGALLYTLNQRHGFTVKTKSSDTKAHYVVAKDLEKNTITISEKPLVVASNKQATLLLRDINWISYTPESGKTYMCRFRHRGALQSCTLRQRDEGWIVEAPHDVALGQSCVIYDGEICLGGGTVDRKLDLF